MYICNKKLISKAVYYYTSYIVIREKCFNVLKLITLSYRCLIDSNCCCIVLRGFNEKNKNERTPFLD